MMNSLSAFLASKISKPMEYIGLAGTFVGLLLKVLHLNGADEILMIGMSVLAMAYFLRAYLPINLINGDRSVVFDFLACSLATRISMIACATVIIGCLFELLHLHGAAEMLLIGVSALGVGTVLGIICLLKDRERYSFFTGYLLRIVPIGLLGSYLFLNLPA